MPNFTAYIPMDRRQALAHGETLPDRAHGAALFADVSGFTPLMRAFARELGPQRGAEALLDVLNPLFESLIKPVHCYRGSVISFVGDAITCWFDAASSVGDPRPTSCLRAVAAALSMQSAMQPFKAVQTPMGTEIVLSIKVAIAFGDVRRFLIGDPAVMQIDALAGATLARMAAAEQRADPNEILVSREVVAQIGEALAVSAWRDHNHFAVVGALKAPVLPQPWPDLPSEALSETQSRPWILPDVYAQLSGGGAVLGDLRPATMLFLRFGGIDYDGDDAAGQKLDAFVRRAQGIVHQRRGNLLQLVIGDKGAYLYAVFGAPVAHEDDPVRALHTALALRDLSLEAGGVGSVQIGAAHGEVWTGLCGAAAHHTYSVMGSEVNLAARLMAAADPGQILISEPLRTQPGVAARFRLALLGARQYKGFADPVPTYVLRGEQLSGAPVFVEALIGRDAELQQLLDRAQPLFAERCAGVILIYGEAGIGKSRLVYALREALGKRAAWFTAPTDPILRQVYNPFVYWLKRYFDQAPEATAVENKARMARRLEPLLARLAGQSGHSALADELVRTSSVLGALLGLYWPGSLYERLDARGRHENTLQGIKALLLAESRLRPVVFELEDGHWLDDASRELLLALTRNVADYPLLFVITSRYADDASRPDLPLAPDIPVFPLDLTALPMDALSAQAGGILGGPVAGSLVGLLQEKTLGNPFFIQQILYYLREKELLELSSVGTWQAKASGFEMPTQLNALLIARIDRLTQQVKEVVQTAAVLGREFEVQVLSRMLHSDVARQVHQAEEEQIWTALHELRYLFKHILLRDAAYKMQLRSRLQELHRLAAETYEQMYADDLSEHYATLAYHYGQALAETQECYYARLAGERAAARFANVEAVIHFSRALELTPDDAVAARYALLLAREKAYNLHGDRVAQAGDLTALKQLAQALGDPCCLSEVSLRQSGYATCIGDYPAAISAAQEAVTFAQLAADPAQGAPAHHAWGEALRRQGEQHEAQVCFERALSLAQAAGMISLAASAFRGLGYVCWQQGDLSKAHSYFEQALLFHRKMGDRSGEASALVGLGLALYNWGDYAAARPYLEESLRLNREIGDRRGELLSLINLGNMLSIAHDPVAGRICLDEALALAREIGDRENEGVIFYMYGDNSYLVGQFDRAEEEYRHSTDLLYAVGSRWQAANALRLLAQVFHARGNYEAARDCAGQALEINREIAGRGNEADSLVHLADALAGLGRCDEAGAAYQEAAVLLREQKLSEVDSLTGLAEMALASGDLNRALALVEQILAFLGEDAFTTPSARGQTRHRLDTWLDPLRVYLACYRVLAAVGDMRASRVLQTGYALLQEWAVLIGDAKLRRSFLEEVPWNRELAAAWTLSAHC